MKKIPGVNFHLDELSLKNEIIGIFLLFLTFFLIFSLGSYSPVDPSFFHSARGERLDNFGGRVGSEISAILFNLFGFASYLIVFFLFFYTAFFLFNRKIKNIIFKSSGFLLMLISSSAFLANIKPHSHFAEMDIQTGGVVGWLLTDFFTGQIKSFFSFLFFLLLLIVSFVMVARISIQSVCKIAAAMIGRLLGGFFRLLKQAVETHRKNRRMKQVKRKYSEEETNRPKEKPLPHEPILKIEKKQPRQPSRIPEETYLFTEFDQATEKRETYTTPPLPYLDAPTEKGKIDARELEEKKKELSQRLQEFRINGEIIEYTPGPVITTFEFVPDIGVKVKDVSSLTEDLALAVKAQYVRIERILGKKAIGIEIPNKKREIILLRELLESPQYRNSLSPLTLALGKTTNGEIFVSDLREMPHLLIAGSTGSGKSVTIHSIILSILYKSSPKTVKFILIDPKRIEMAIYNSLPHLLTPVVVNPKLAKNALDWAVVEMESRYKKLATLQVRNIEQFNKKLELLIQSEDEEIDHLEDKEKIPYIVIIIDELADLMMSSARDIEENITRLAQKARAVGIHLILATQRPSIDVITGPIKNNFPSRIALAVPSKYDSRTIIDQMGAEKLLGNGDMLFLPPKTASLIRLHGAYVSEQETIRVVNFLAKLEKPEFNTQIIRQVQKKDEKNENQELDDLFYEAAETIITTGQASASHLQRRMSIGYARAGRLIDQLQSSGIISAANKQNQRDILMTLEDLQKLKLP
jgi:S-DNA-T family DNA segregation ATPase FtsK/SpoIIIE